MKSRTRRTFQKILIAAATILAASSAFQFTVAKNTPAAESHAATGAHAEEKKFNAGELILDHIGDSHEWHVAGEGDNSIVIPLPVIVYSKERGLDVFMSGNFHHGHKTYKGYKSQGRNIIAVNELEPVDVDKATVNETITSHLWDFSITKNVASLIFSSLFLIWIFLSVAKAYSRRKDQAPKGLQSLMEPLVLFVRDDIVRPAIGEKHYKRFLPFLLTAFFFIWFNNLMGLIPIPPGGTNLTGNIAITMTLAVMVFIITSLNGTKEYWTHIFAMPGVPKWVLIILTPIEILGVFLRPFVLMIRLFANMLAGHIIALSFFSLIFIFGEMNTILGYGVSVFSIGFTLFMGALELLVAFLQAYVFTLLASIYFGSALEEHHNDTAGHDAKVEEAAIV